MGAWGVNAFDSDEGCDWIDDFLETQDVSMIESTVRGTVDCTEYLELTPAAHALAACEVLASLKGNPGPSKEDAERVAVWMDASEQAIDSRVYPIAGRAIDRVLAAKSELQELWSESDSHQLWLAYVDDLRARLA